MFVLFFFFFFVFKDEPELISIYHPTAKEIFASMGTPMGGFFDRANVVFEIVIPAPPAAAQGVIAKAPIPSTRLVPIGEDTYMKRVSETTPIPAKTFTLQEGVIPPVVTQTKVASPTTPLVISTSDPFAALSQATKDGFSLMVTSSSIPSSATVDLM